MVRNIFYNGINYIRRILPGLIIAALAIIAGGCVKNEFKVTFLLPEDVNSTYRLSYYASDSRGGLQIETAVAIASGKGEMIGMTRKPALCAISTGISDIPAAIFYAERGDKIAITGKDSDPLTWNIEGNKITKTLTEWRLENAELIREARNVARGAEEREARRKLNKAVEKFVTENPDSKASAFLLVSYFDAYTDPAGFKRLTHIIEESDVADQVHYLLSRQDLDTSTPPVTDISKLKLADLLLRNISGSADSLRLGSASTPALIYYWRRNDPEYYNIIDSLKTLARWRPDTASMVIADICLTSDSIQWVSEMRRDSLKHTLRSFIPSGMADPVAMNHGVGSTPWFIVAAGKGKAAYAGPDFAEAAKKFRALRPKK